MPILCVKHEFYEELLENSKFHWSHTFYKGDKYENLGEKVFKYSLVELEDSPIESGSKTTKALLDIFIGYGNDNGVRISYEKSILKAYISKVMEKKLVVDTHLPYIDGKTILAQHLDAEDNTEYNSETYEYYKNKSINSRTQYSSFVYDNYETVRKIKNYPMYGSKSQPIIATATQYAEFVNNELKYWSGVWGFWIHNGGYKGKIYSTSYWVPNDPDRATRYHIQLII